MPVPIIVVAILLIIIGSSIYFVGETLDAVFSNIRYYKYYKKQYKLLSNMQFIKIALDADIIYGYLPTITPQLGTESFMWFSSENHFKIDVENEVYLHRAKYVFNDPYALYWYNKFLVWCENNIEINKVPSYFNHKMGFIKN
jgi:hypothetical protein